MLLQAMHALLDERCEYLIKDRLSFMRFLGLGPSDAVPDANTIWNFREALKRVGAVDALFAQFDAALKTAGVGLLAYWFFDPLTAPSRHDAMPSPDPAPVIST